MYARSITIEGEPHRTEAGVDYVRDEVMPMLAEMDGYIGLSMLADRETGQVIVTSSWRTDEQMQATLTKLAPVRNRGLEIMGGTMKIDEWEVAVMHRDHTAREGACCRVTWMRVNRGQFDRGIDLYRTTMLPEMESLEGFCSASLMVNRAAARACNTTTYDSRESLEASRERSWAIRDAGVREAGVDVADVMEFELVLAHLRLPELV